MTGNGGTPGVRPGGWTGPSERVWLRPLARAVWLATLALALWYFLDGVEYDWSWQAVWRYRALFVTGFRNTVLVSLGAIVLGFGIGVAGGVARVSPNPFLSEAAAIYVEVFRGTPLLAQIYIFYFCVFAVIRFDDPLLIGMIVLAVFSGAYVTEIVRAGIQSVDRGQWEAALATGFSHFQALRWVIFPQAFRRIIPAVAGQFVSLIKDSSLLSVIAVRELTKSAEMVNATTYRTFEVYLPLAILYLLLTYPLTCLTYWLERRLDKRSRPAAH